MLATICALFALPTIWIVDANNGTGTNFTDLPPAVAAAANGDTILVRAGTYTAFQVSGKSLTIRGDGIGISVIGNLSNNSLPTSIANVPAGSLFILSGLSIAPSVEPTAAGFECALTITGTSTVAVLSNCAVTASGAAAAPYWTGIMRGLVVDAATVFASGCSFTGKSYGLLGAFGGPSPHGVIATNATIAATGCRFVGGDWYIAWDGAGSGGSGVMLSHSRCTVHGCSINGGNGVGRATGAIALRATNQSVARVAGRAADIVQAGASPNGTSAFAIAADTTSQVICNGPVGLAGAGPQLISGAVTLNGVALPRLGIAALALANGEIRVGTPMLVQLDGVLPGAAALLGLDAAPVYSTALAPLTVGEVFLQVGAFAFGVTLDSAGQFTHAFPPTATPALIGQPVFAQAAVLDPAAAQFRMSNLDVHLFTL